MQKTTEIDWAHNEMRLTTKNGHPKRNEGEADKRKTKTDDVTLYDDDMRIWKFNRKRGGQLNVLKLPKRERTRRRRLCIMHMVETVKNSININCHWCLKMSLHFWKPSSKIDQNFATVILG